ncbi:MAG: hypothetical protein K8R40_03300 [Anaerolineaceae bacterium]|nr:hypothetical protein [Anaerolineaceae bacterium]
MDIMDMKDGMILFSENCYYPYEDLVNYIKMHYQFAEKNGEKPSNKTNPIFNHLPVNVLRSYHRYPESVESGIKLMDEIHKIDSEFYEALHKGTPYYWIACSAFQSHDYDTATYFFNAAAEEDIRDGAQINMDDKNVITGTSPALSFMMLDVNNKNQAAIKLTEEVHKSFITCIEKYNDLQGCDSDLSLIKIQLDFILRSIKPKETEGSESQKSLNWQPLVTSMIAFLLEWNYKASYINLYPETGNYFPFFSHLFKGCVLFESLLKMNPSIEFTQSSLGDILNGNDEVKEALGITSSLRPHSRGFDGLLADLSENFSIQEAMGKALKIRNTTGHNLAWNTEMSQDQYNQLAGMVFSSCLHVIAKLYVCQEE